MARGDESDFWHSILYSESAFDPTPPPFSGDSWLVHPAWQKLARTRLFADEQVARLRARFEAQAQASPDLDVWTWLVQEGALTEFQSLLLAGGLSGPFRYDNYLVESRLSEGPLLGAYQARHQPSRHAVHLDFFTSELPSAQQDWQALVKRAEKLASIHHPALVPTLEAVTLNDFAFVVSDLPGGSCLEQKLPRKARLPWPVAAAMGARIAAALGELQRLDLIHGAISPRAIWLSGRSAVKLRMNWRRDTEFDFVLPETEESKHDYLAPELIQGHSASLASDLYSLACLLYRMISGRAVTQGISVDDKIRAQLHGTPKDLGKYEIPVSLQQLINTLLLKSPAARPTDAQNVARMLAEIAGQSLEQLLPKVEPAASLQHLRQTLLESTPVVAASRTIDAAASVTVAAAAPPRRTADSSKPALTASEWQHIRQKKQRRTWLAVATSVALFALALGLIAWRLSGSQQRVALHLGSQSRTAASHPTMTNDPVASPPITEAAPLASDSAAVIRQTLVEDDGKLLWQSPTAGAPQSFAFLPPGAKLVLTVRPQSLLADEQGQLLLQACGAELNAQIADWSRANGIEFADCSQIVVGFYPSSQLKYQVLAHLRLDPPRNESDLLLQWKATAAENGAESGTETDSGMGPIRLAPGERAFLITRTQSEPATSNRRVESFLAGPRELVEAAAELANSTELSGPLGSLSSAVDEQRHFNLLFIPAGLFNDEGQSLMTGSWAPLNRRLQTMMDDSLRAGLLSVHLDQGCYLELIFNHSADMKPAELQQRLNDRLRMAREEITQALTGMAASPYWERVRLRYDNMVTDAYRNLRMGVENRNLIANCWLPPMAAHNLLAGAELALALGESTGSSPEIAVDSPQTLEELLSRPRSLKVTTNPDLNVLLQNIATEVNEQYPGMPFKFRIEMQGNDLVKEGITQNQRPGDFTAENEPLSQILTQIMFRANPDKSAPGPNDPRCKLVWIIAPDPANPGQNMIQVTTRAAAVERSLALPPDFQEPK